ncbi:MAG: hypothetical protein OXG47_01245, partial [bacterium]|nr:hypothetical protein [bacterium]
MFEAILGTVGFLGLLILHLHRQTTAQVAASETRLVKRMDALTADTRREVAASETRLVKRMDALTADTRREVAASETR